MFDPNLFPDPNSCYPPPAFAGDEFPAREGREENPAELLRTRSWSPLPKLRRTC